jgi:hypothetical protein
LCRYRIADIDEPNKSIKHVYLMIAKP